MRDWGQEWGTHRFDGIRDQVTAREPNIITNISHKTRVVQRGLNQLTSSASLLPFSVVNMSAHQSDLPPSVPMVMASLRGRCASASTGISQFCHDMLAPHADRIENEPD